MLDPTQGKHFPDTPYSILYTLILACLLHPLSADRGDEGDAGWNFMAGEMFATSRADGGAQGFLVGGEADDIDSDGLAGERMGFAVHTAISHARDA